MPSQILFSTSAKKAVKRRTKSASLSLTSSPAFNFKTDFSGASLSEAPADLASQIFVDLQLAVVEQD
jgi:hypothetical protein